MSGCWVIYASGKCSEDHYALLNIHTLECTHVEVQLEHIEEMLREDFQESITEIIAPEHIKIVAKNVI